VLPERSVPRARSFSGPQCRHPEVSMHTAVARRSNVDLLNRGETCAGVRRPDARVPPAKPPRSIGADFLICPDNTIHEAFFIRPSPRSSAAVACHIGRRSSPTEAAGRGFLRLWGDGEPAGLVEEPGLFRKKSSLPVGLECVRPHRCGTSQRVDRNHLEELVVRRVQA